MEPSFVLRGFAAGVVATFSMLLAEVPAFRRFGYRGVFEWHEIQAVASWAGRAETRSVLVFPLHLLAGGVAGILFAMAVSSVPLGVTLVLQGLALGLILWILTLLLHRSVTRVHPWRNDMGLGPIAASLAGHLLYGSTLGLLMI